MRVLVINIGKRATCSNGIFTGPQYLNTHSSFFDITRALKRRHFCMTAYIRTRLPKCLSQIHSEKIKWWI